MDHTLSCSFIPGYLPSSIRIIIRHKAIIIAIHQGGGDHKICGGTIACNRNVPHNRYAQERLDIGIVGLRFERSPEKHKEIDLNLACGKHAKTVR
jgi:hypothetical protein